jgi:signal transduction histidine kinase/ActR/RegA family two-component response regulator
VKTSRFRSSIRLQLAGVTMLAMAVALIFAFVAFAAYEVRMFRRETVASTSTLAGIVGANSTAAILFNDSDAASRTLLALDGVAGVVAAALYKADGQIFATYVRSPTWRAIIPDRVARGGGFRFERGRLSLFAPIGLEGEPVGVVFVATDLRLLNERLRQYLLMAVAILFASGAIAWLLSLYLHLWVAKPLLGLTEVARQIAERQNFTARVSDLGRSDELGVLVRGFNQMLERIQAHDTERREIHAGLEARVQGRTAELAAANAALRAEIEERTRIQHEVQEHRDQLQNALSQLRTVQERMVRHERMSALGQMAGGVAHDFNNVLTPIVGYADLLVSLLQDSPAQGDALAMAREILTAANDAKDIIQRVSRLYRTETQESDSVDIGAAVQGALAITEPKWRSEMSARGAGIKIVVRTEGASRVAGGESALREALTNLFLNAVDAMPRGGTLTVSAEDVGDRVVVKVADTGCGMAAWQLRHCFSPFFTTKGAHGTGLGLAIVHSIVESHRGEIEVQSELDKGTTFTIRLPRWTARLERSANEWPSPIRPLRILLVDDDPRTVHVIARYLRADGHVVEQARSGEEGIGKFGEGAFDLVITDRAMPDVSGDKVAEAVKARRAEVLVIMLTGFGWVMKDRQEKPAGVDMVLAKPVTRAELRESIAALCTAALSARPEETPVAAADADAPPATIGDAASQS